MLGAGGGSWEACRPSSVFIGVEERPVVGVIGDQAGPPI
jgi:hypothetical protein